MKLKKLLSLLLALCMTLSLLVPAAKAQIAAPEKPQTQQSHSQPAWEGQIPGLSTLRDPIKQDPGPQGSWTVAKVDNNYSVNLLAGENECLKELRQAAKQFADQETVAAFILMQELPLVESFGNINDVPQAETDRLVSRQDELIATIERTVLGGEKLNVRYQFTYLTNAISVRTQFGNLEKIARLSGVKSVYLVPQYEPCTVKTPIFTPSTAPSADGTGVTQARNELGYTGTGMSIAIIDTGLEQDHPSFADAPEANENSITEDHVAAVLDRLNAKQARPSLTASQLYCSEKVPYAFNYVDTNLITDHSQDYQGYHGTHVAGIAAANAISSTDVVGMAPDAQIVVMKVFGANGGAYDDDIVAALEDALTLGCDAVNLSLGSPCGFTSENPEIDAIYDRIRDYDVVVTIAAGNEGTSGYSNTWGYDLNKTSDPDNATVGSPSTYTNATSIASADNFALFSNYLAVENTHLAYLDAIGPDYLFGILDSQPQPYVMIPGMGKEADYEGLDVEGKIAVVCRGEITFGEKLAFAEAKGAIGMIVYNNEPGMIQIQLYDDYGNLPAGVSGEVPVCSVSMAAGKRLADAVEKTVTLGEGIVPNEDGGQISSFSSWGAAPDLRLVPDLTGIGGGVMSTAIEGSYESMSGTSMATPQVAGISVLILEYLHEVMPDLAASEYHKLANCLLMSTAQPIISNFSHVEASPRQQGAGLVQAYNALTAESYLTVGGDRPKAELYDDPAKTGSYCFTFEVHNISNAPQTYSFSGSILTEDAVAHEGELFMAGYDRDLEGEITFSSDSLTVQPGTTAQVTATVTLSAAAKAWLEENYPNGGYVEGFVYAENQNGVDLSLPYMGFYGDWTQAPTLDSAYWYHDSFWVNTPEPDGAMLWNVLWTNLDGQDGVLGMNPYGDLPTGDMDTSHFVLSNNGDNVLDNISDIYLSLLRNAKTVSVTYTDTETGEVYDTEILQNISKSMYNSSYGMIFPAIYSWYSNRFYDFTDSDGKPLPNNTKLDLTVKATQDYDRHPQDPESDSFTFTITLDTEAPQFLGMEESAGDQGNFITITFSDNVDPAAVFLLNATGTRILDSWTDLKYNGDGTYSLAMDVSGFGTDLQLVLCDYAGNEQAYTMKYTLNDNLPQLNSDTLYAYRVIDSSMDTELCYGWTSIDKEDATIRDLASDRLESCELIAAEYAGGYVFGVDSNLNLVAMVPGLWTRIPICELGVYITDMAFDRSSNTMYAIKHDSLSSALIKLNLLTGEMTELATYHDMYEAPLSFTIDDTGRFWCVAYHSSNLWTLDKNWQMTPVTDADGSPIVLFTSEEVYSSTEGDMHYISVAPYSNQSMTYCTADDRIYWAYYSDYGAPHLFTIDPNTLTYETTRFRNDVCFVGLITLDDGLVSYECDGIRCPSEDYVDVEAKKWYHEGIDYVIANGYMTGTSPVRFSPQLELNRAMMVTVLYRLAGEPAVAVNAGFEDVPEDSWYAKAVSWAVNTGITKGTSATTFSPKAPANREQMATFLYRYAMMQGYRTDNQSGSLDGFADVSMVHEYALPAMKWAVSEGLINGVSSSLLAPQANATRAQFATILLRLYKQIIGGYSIPKAPLSRILLKEEQIILCAGSKTTVQAQPSPWNASMEQLSWSSGDESIATVTPDGEITGIAHGTVTITATCGALTADLTVRVVELDGTAYAYNYFSGAPVIEDWISFDLSNISGGYTSLTASPVDFVAADYNGHDGYIYGYNPYSQLYRYSLESGECTALGSSNTSYIIRDMAYDYSTGIMYALKQDGQNEICEICCVNMNTGALVPMASCEYYYCTLACSTDGRLYACDEGGAISRLLISDGVVTEADTIYTGLYPYYLQSMCYDHNNDVLLWASPEQSAILLLDPATGEMLQMGDPIGSGVLELTGLFVIPETVEPLPYVPVSSALAWDMTVLVGQTLYPSVFIIPVNATNQIIQWTSLDPDVLKVNEDGTVTGVSPGTAQITGILTDGDETYQLSFQAEVLASADNLYGFVHTDFATNKHSYWLSITDADLFNSQISTESKYSIYAGEYHDGKIYAYGSGNYSWDETCHFITLDPRDFMLLEDIELDPSFNYYVYDMTYDYATGNMYALAGLNDENRELFLVNTTTGELIPRMALDRSISSIAAAPDGTLYAMSSSTIEYDYDTSEYFYSNACLYTLNVEEGTCEYFGDTGVLSNLNTSMTFDFDSGYLYWNSLFSADYSNSMETGLHLIDVTKGAEALNLGKVGVAGGEIHSLIAIADQYPAEPEPSLQEVLLNREQIVLAQDEQLTLDATVLSLSLEGYSLSWKSSQPDVAAVDESGTVTALSPGTATVTVTANRNTQTASASCEVVVLNKDAGYLVYNATNPGWTRLSRSDVRNHTQLNTEAEGQAPVIAADFIADTIYGYDAFGSFFFLDEDYDRFVIAENVLDLNVDPEMEEIFQLRDMGYNPVTQELLVLGATMGAAYYSGSDMWDYYELRNMNCIYSVNMNNGKLTKVCSISNMKAVRGMTVSDDGTVYIFCAADDCIYTLDLATGNTTQVADLHDLNVSTYADYYQYMDYDCVSKELCLLVMDGSVYRQLVTLDLDTLLLTNWGAVGNVSYTEDGWPDDSDEYMCLLVKN